MALNYMIAAYIIGLLFIIYLVAARDLTGQKALVVASVYLLFPLFIIFLDDLYAKGLLDRALNGNDAVIWAARLTFAIAVITFGRGLYIIALPALLIATLSIFLKADTLRPKPPRFAEKSKIEEAPPTKLNTLPESNAWSKGIVTISDIPAGESITFFLDRECDSVILFPDGCLWRANCDEDINLYKWLPDGTRYLRGEVEVNGDTLKAGVGKVCLKLARKPGPGEKVPMTITHRTE